MDRDFLLELFSTFGPVSLRRMFSGYGVSVDGVNFALVLRGAIYFRADGQTVPQFENEGSKPFQYDTRNKVVTVASYWQLPDRLYDDPEELAQWARAALGAAQRAAARKRSRAPRAASKKGSRAASKTVFKTVSKTVFKTGSGAGTTGRSKAPRAKAAKVETPEQPTNSAKARPAKARSAKAATRKGTAKARTKSRSRPDPKSSTGSRRPAAKSASRKRPTTKKRE